MPASKDIRECVFVPLEKMLTLCNLLPLVYLGHFFAQEFITALAYGNDLFSLQTPAFRDKSIFGPPLLRWGFTSDCLEDFVGNLSCSLVLCEGIRIAERIVCLLFSYEHACV